MEGFGVLTGLMFALLLAFAITMYLVGKSNDLGKVEEEFKDFSRQPLKYLRRFDEK